jgi:hypothetical protein
MQARATWFTYRSSCTSAPSTETPLLTKKTTKRMAVLPPVEELPPVVLLSEELPPVVLLSEELPLPTSTQPGRELLLLPLRPLTNANSVALPSKLLLPSALSLPFSAKKWVVRWRAAFWMAFCRSAPPPPPLSYFPF